MSKWPTPYPVYGLEKYVPTAGFCFDEERDSLSTDRCRDCDEAEGM